MKYKVGDKVRVKENLIAGELYGKDIFASEMVSFKGKFVTIKKIQENKYLIKEDLENWYWTEEMFSSINKYNIGDKVLVRKDLIEYEKYGGQSFVPSMSNFQGKIVTICDVADNGYRIKEDSQNWRWTNEMFSPIITKYKIGDKVRVREDIESGKGYGGNSIVQDMLFLRGKVVTISDIEYGFYRLKEDSGRWSWTSEMFSGKVSEDFSPEESDLQSTIPEEESSSDIIFTIKPIKAKLLLL